MQRPVGVPDNRKIINKATGQVYKAKDHEEKSIAIAKAEKESTKKELDNIMQRLGLMGLSLSDLPTLNNTANKEDKNTLENKDKNKSQNKASVDQNKIKQDTPKV